MSAVAQLSGAPSQFEAGTTQRFTTSDSDFPASAWTMSFVLNNGVDAPASIAATADGDGFEVVIPASTVLTPGSYTWAEYFTAISPTTEKARGKTGFLEVLSNLSAAATPTFAQAQVTRLQTALAALSASDKQSVSFNGQSFTRANIPDYQRQITYWEARVIAEKSKAAVIRGRYENHYPWCR